MSFNRGVDETCPRLFVYGTLRHGLDNPAARMLASRATFEGNAGMQGRLYAVGEYTGMVLTTGRDGLVRGDLFTLHAPSETLALLDDYEGCGRADAPPCEFERVLANAVMEDGSTVDSWVYVYSGPLSEANRLIS